MAGSPPPSPSGTAATRVNDMDSLGVNYVYPEVILDKSLVAWILRICPLYVFPMMSYSLPDGKLKLSLWEVVCGTSNTK